MLAQDTDREVRIPEDEGAAQEPEPRAPDMIREINGTAGHGVARAYGFIALAAAYGCKAELVEGSTRSGSRMKLKVAVYAPEGMEHRDAETVLGTLSGVYAALAQEAEKCAREKREHARREAEHPPVGYELNRFTRAVLAGFLQGAAGVLKTEHALRPEPYRLGSRARAVDENAHKSGLAAGRAYARNVLLPQLQNAAQAA